MQSRLYFPYYTTYIGGLTVEKARRTHKLLRLPNCRVLDFLEVDQSVNAD
jgi:hypothetical protein